MTQLELLPTNQTAAILAHLETGATLTPLEALDRFGCFRLGARIWDLRRAGWEIEATMVPVGNGKRVASYRLLSERERAARAVLA